MELDHAKRSDSNTFDSAAGQYQDQARRVEDHFRNRCRRYGSTGFGDGIAIPHCHVSGLDRFCVGVVSAPHGVDFDAADGKPVYLLLFIIAPAEQRNEHVALLASVSHVLTNQKAREEMLNCEDETSLLDCFRKWWNKPKALAGGGEKSLLQIFVQREELLTDIIQTLSEIVPGHISVLDGQNARAFLHRLPIFSGFWTDTETSSIRIVTAVVNTDNANDVSRRIMLLAGDTDVPGLMVTSQDLRFSIGSLEL